MAQNSFVLDEIDREAMKVRADDHLQKSLPYGTRNATKIMLILIV